MTKTGLRDRLDATRGLTSVPCIVTNPQAVIGVSVRTQARDVLVPLRRLFRECRELAQLLWLRFWSIKRWLLV